MSFEYPCQWPMAIDVLRVRPSNLGLDVALNMSIGRGVVSSVHLDKSRAAYLCQDIVAVAHPEPVTWKRFWPCEYFKADTDMLNWSGLTVDLESDGTVAVRVQGGLCYLNKDQAREAAIALLRMCASE